jgi:hypothetical protein
LQNIFSERYRRHFSFLFFSFFFANYTIHQRHSQRTHTHPYKYTHANPTPSSIFEDCAGKSSRLTKSPQPPRCRRERHLPLKAQTTLNPNKFPPTGCRTQELRCYQCSCNHRATDPFARRHFSLGRPHQCSNVFCWRSGGVGPIWETVGHVWK